jgi:hypothetical protein
VKFMVVMSAALMFGISSMSRAMGNIPGEKAETLTLLKNLSAEPLAKDATRDVPANIDDTQAACLTRSAAAPVSQPAALSPYDAMGSSLGDGVQ